MPDSPLLDALLLAAGTHGASDIILHTGRPPVFRIHGDLITTDSPPLGEEEFRELENRCLVPMGAFDHDAALISGDGTRFRVNLLRNLGSRAAVLRRIRAEIPAMESLGLPSDLLGEWAARPSGLVIVAGPTGSGKSTSVAAMLEWINQRSARHIVTIEDPVEFVFQSKMSLFTQREVGLDTASFAEGLRRSLRQNPDVIFLGEIRDGESAVTAVRAAETGHLVFATLHASDVSETVDRMQTFFPATEREAVRKTLASQLLGVLCLRLIPAKTGGLVLMTEYFSNIASSRKLIAEGRVEELKDFMRRGDPRQSGSFASSLLALVRSGKVEESEAMALAENPQEFSRLLRGIQSAGDSTRR